MVCDDGPKVETHPSPRFPHLHVIVRVRDDVGGPLEHGISLPSVWSDFDEAQREVERLNQIAPVGDRYVLFTTRYKGHQVVEPRPR